MDSGTAERWVTISALVVILVYGWRRVIEPAKPGTLRNLLGQSPPVPLGQFVTAWGFTFFVISILAEASPSVGGSFAILVAAADLLNNLQPALADVQRRQRGPIGTPATAAGNVTRAGDTTAGIALSGLSLGGSGYVAPLRPRSTSVGRTDQGVDLSAPPGTPVRSIGAARVVGISPNWFQGQPFVWTQILSGPLRGRFVYYAEQLIPHVHPGQVVRAGQPIGTVAPSGTGLELGFATQSGATLARATTGYTEGQATPAGQQFASFLKTLGL